MVRKAAAAAQGRAGPAHSHKAVPGGGAWEGPRLTSLYTVGRSECEITTYTHTFQACIDYVYALGKVSPSGLTHIPVPTKAELGGPIPSAMEPSDHLPLGVEIPL